MFHIKTFESFIIESYNRYPLYHFTYSGKIFDIMKEDLLRVSKPYLPHPNMPQESISLTRNKLFSEKRHYKIRLELDSAKLLAAGFKPVPISEFNLGKKILPTDYNIPSEQEEERIYKSIPNIGKYITSIEVNNLLLGYTVDNFLFKITKDAIKKEIKILTDFLLKYPHITLKQTWDWKIDKNSPIINAEFINKFMKEKEKQP